MNKKCKTFFYIYEKFYMRQLHGAEHKDALSRWDRRHTCGLWNRQL